MIRQATFEDIPRMIEIGAVMHKESRYRELSYCPEKLTPLLKLIIEHGFAMVAEKDGHVFGLFIGLVEEHWFSTDKIATDLALFVEPGKRGGLAACMLTSAFLDWAESKGAKMTDILINTGVRTEETAKLFDRLGGRSAGLVYSWGG